MPIVLMLGGGAILAIAVVAILSAGASSVFSILLLQRGWTQYASLYLASATAVFLIAKGIRLGLAAAQLRQATSVVPTERWTPDEPSSMEAVRDALAQERSPLSLRRARAFQAFLMTGRRSAAVAVADEDAAVAQSTSEASYSAPRAMIWAIPLMGFIGTVIGISDAVAGFSGFLQQTEEIEQIKSAIGGVTTGLAVAFDTTLVALALSVLVMLPLVLLERFEQRLLLTWDAIVGDSLIARLPESGDTTSAPLDTGQIVRAVTETIAAHMPNPREMVRAAEMHLRSAAEVIAARTTEASRMVAESADLLRRQQVAVGEALAEEVEHFQRTVAQREEAALAQLRLGTEGLATALDGASLTLARRTEDLVAQSRQVSEVLEIEKSLARTLHALETTGDLRGTLAGVDRSLGELMPVLDRLAQPRQMVLMERVGLVEGAAAPASGTAAPASSYNPRHDGNHV